MDELKLRLSSRFMNHIVTKIIKKTIMKKFGYQIDISIKDLDVTNINGKIHVHVNADAEMDNSEFLKIIKDVGLD